MELITDQEIISGYLSDASNTHGAAEALARPSSAEEVSGLIRNCQRYGIPLTVTARRTSTTGGPVPDGGWLMSMERLDSIVSSREVEGGVLLGEYQTFTEREGLLFPPDPTSRNECSVGAAIACNASGARSFRYGPTRPWVDAVEAVLPDGTIVHADRETPIPADWPRVLWAEPAVKTAAGYYPAANLLDLLIGQEGTLGVITRAWLRLLPKPEDVLGMIVFFSSLPDCLAFVRQARAGAQRPLQPAASLSLNPRALEFFDHHSMDLIRARVDGIPSTAVCGLFIEIEHDGDPPLEQWFGALEECGALTDYIIAAEDPPSRERLYAIRHAIPAGVNELVVANGMPKVGTDFAVPDEALGEMMEAYSSVPMRHVLFGHIGDSHLHLNLLPNSEAELLQAKELYRKLALKAVSLGGTVSAEHGIGRIKKGLLSEMVGPGTLASFHALKAHLDPAWILGRGILFHPPEYGV
jgi:D-lactate dehydrogenase (cytochrome)